MSFSTGNQNTYLPPTNVPVNLPANFNVPFNPQINDYQLFNELQNLYKKRSELNEFILFKERQLKLNYNSSQWTANNQLLHVLNQIQKVNGQNGQNGHAFHPTQVLFPEENKKELNLPQEEYIIQMEKECVESEETLKQTAADNLMEANKLIDENKLLVDETKEQQVESCNVFSLPGSYAQAVMKNNLKPETNNLNLNINSTIDYSPLFKKVCTQCQGYPKHPKCKNFKSVHVNDDNYNFATLPYQNRCLRSHCLDLVCQRNHHPLTVRLSMKCTKQDCTCPHYVHLNDTYHNKPYFWKPYNESVDKPSKEILDSYFLLKKKD